MRLREDNHPHNNFALAVRAPSIDTKVDAANWPPSPRIPLKHHFRSIQILAPFTLVGYHRQHGRALTLSITGAAFEARALMTGQTKKAA
jgi:hypothetical protein